MVGSRHLPGDQGPFDLCSSFPAEGLSRAERVYPKMQRVNVDFPRWMVESLDKEADRLSVTRQSLIKIWIAERLERVAS